MLSVYVHCHCRQGSVDFNKKAADDNYLQNKKTRNCHHFLAHGSPNIRWSAVVIVAQASLKNPNSVRVEVILLWAHHASVQCW